MNGGIINSITRLHLVGYLSWAFVINHSAVSRNTTLINKHYQFLTRFCLYQLGTIIEYK
jgi:hypothetical protein